MSLNFSASRWWSNDDDDESGVDPVSGDGARSEDTAQGLAAEPTAAADGQPGEQSPTAQSSTAPSQTGQSMVEPGGAESQRDISAGSMQTTENEASQLDVEILTVEEAAQDAEAGESFLFDQDSPTTALWYGESSQPTETVRAEMTTVEAVTIDEGAQDRRADMPVDATPDRPAVAPGGPPVADVGRSGPVDDGGRRRRSALVIVLVALLTAGLGMFIGSRIQSPADRAASQAAPEPSLITVAVEKQTLASELVLNGTVAFNEPITVRLAGAVGIDTQEKAILTAVPAVGDEVVEGTPVLEVTNRPVLALQGSLPMYRTINVGTTGPDVAQLETALQRLGFDPGAVDEVADDATMAAVTEMYAAVGFPPAGATTAETTALNTAKKQVADAQSNLTSARSQLKKAGTSLSNAERMELDRAVTAAAEAIPIAQTAVGTTTQEQNAAVVNATSERDNANRNLADMQAKLNSARAGATNPETQEFYTAAEINDLARQVASAASAATAAAAALNSAEAARTTAIAAANRAVGDAQYQLELAKVRRNDSLKPADTGDAAEAVTSAETALADAQTELNKARVEAGVRVPAGEVIFVPTLPASLTEWSQPIGAEATGQMGAIASSATQVTAKLSRADAGSVPVGANVSVEIRDAGVTMAGVVKSVGEPVAKQQTDQGFGGSGNTNDGRLEVVVEPADPAAMVEYVNFSARVVVEVESTGTEQLVVPVAALSVGPDGEDRVEVERAAATPEQPAKTEMVPVTVGLTANGLAAVTPKDGALAAGDRVVIGFEYPDRQIQSDNTAAAGSSPEKTSTGAGDDSSTDSSDEGTSGDSSSSPMADFLGVSGDPVKQREQMLAVEESVAKCMTAEGFEYKPVDYGADANMGAYLDPAFGEKNGYGVVYQYETFESQDAESEGMTDPNQDYVASLDEAEVGQYYTALYGPQAFGGGDAGDDTAATAPPLEEQGCYGKAQSEVMGDSLINDPTVWSRLDELAQQVKDDPEYKKLNAAWKDCMAEPLKTAGIAADPQTADDMQAAVQRLLWETQGGTVVEFQSEQELASMDVANATYNDDGTGVAVTGELKPLSSDEIERTRQLEVELWKADQACQKEVGLDTYRTESEAKMVEQLQSELQGSQK